MDRQGRREPGANAQVSGRLTVVQSLSAKLKMGGAGKAKAAPAAKVATFVKPAPSAGAHAASPATSASATSPSPAPTPKSGPPRVTKKAAKAEAADAAPAPAAPVITDQGSAWAALVENKGEAADQTVTDAWIAACNEVGPDLEPEKFTPAQWVKVYSIAMSKITT